MATPNCVNDIVLEHLIVVSKGTGGNCKVKCRYCEKEFTGSQTRQLAHVAGIKGQGVSICGEGSVAVDQASTAFTEFCKSLDLDCMLPAFW